MRWRRPEGLLQLDADVGTGLARLTAIEGFSRAVMVGVVPLAALEALGSKAAVSYVFLAGAAITMLFTINVGRLEQLIQRRWVITFGAGLLLVATFMFMFVDGPLFAVAIGLRSAEASIFSVCISLYIMDFIGKAELTRTESRRMVHNGAAWFVGPTLGVWLWSHHLPVAPFVISAAATIATVWYFWRLRFHHNAVLLTPTTRIDGPWHNVVRFFRQKNLRIAYAIMTSRAVFWAALFVYGPIYVVESGLPDWCAGVFLSAASAMLFFSPLVRRCADMIGARTTIISAFTVMALAMAALAVVGDARPIGVLFWLTGAAAGAALDVLANIPFMRMVKPRERTAMTTVFTTWRELSFLLAPLIAAVALALSEFWLLYAVLACLLAGSAIASTYLPRRL